MHARFLNSPRDFKFSQQPALVPALRGVVPVTGDAGRSGMGGPLPITSRQLNFFYRDCLSVGTLMLNNVEILIAGAAQYFSDDTDSEEL
jgi:hypothetical protein